MNSMPLESAIFQRKSDLRQLRIIARGRAIGALLAAGDGVGAEVLHRLADREDVRRIGERFAEPDRDAARPGAAAISRRSVRRGS